MGRADGDAVGAEMNQANSMGLFVKLGILIAVTIAVGAFSYSQLQRYAASAAEQHQLAELQQMVPILVLKEDLDADVRLVMEHFQQRNFPPQYIQDNWLEPHDAVGLIGLKTSRFLARGEPLTLDAFRYDYRNHFSQRLAENRYAITVSVGIEQLHHGLLAVGDKVLLYSAARLGQGARWLADIEILAIDRQQQPIQQQAGLPTTLTLAMSASQAQQFEVMRELSFQVWLQHPQHNYPELTVTAVPMIHRMQLGTGVTP